ncbi:uncharacterized protein PHALS_06390 [Plasmopara halstedii]|uniref:Uncharacterized protein n=1 Tax=Plasmopara halstedii TaxID=4781 RepID=A0A0P1B2B3_PLAHL|nr:uncharacterized protein PHALS_06390 [Plasmopara halstedii]CEG48574.1 hypothetical protein PHALS_06390 [Plasmopara halstedii]|eukprot:XP_024584943.1 hypothetical protein PHALS_06390 [Plasmopara halstedii]
MGGPPTSRDGNYQNFGRNGDAINVAIEGGWNTGSLRSESVMDISFVKEKASDL